MDTRELLYFNDFGGFSKDRKEYIIKTNEKFTPTPWSHMIANKNFGTIVTANGGGYTWSKNSRDNKITTWSNDPVTDKPSEMIWIEINNQKDGSGQNEGIEKIYAMPYKSLEGYEIHFGFGYAKYKYNDKNINQELLIYVPIDQNKKVSRYEIENKLEEEQEIKVYYYVEPVLGVAREYTKKHLVFEKIEKGVKISNYYREVYNEESVLIKCSEDDIEIKEEEKKLFITTTINLKPNEKRIVFFELIIKEKEDEDIEKETTQKSEENLEKITEFWNEKLGTISVRTPVESMNIMLNGWLGYQTIVSRLWGRTSFYQAGGAYGFRDQLQDSLIMLYLDPKFTRNQILYHAMHQFKEGDVLHWWHPEKSNGIRTRYTDDLLWLPYLISEYILKEKDYEVLDEEVQYVQTNELEENENERYGEVVITEDKENLYMHAIRAIEKSLNFGENGLPEIGTGDWNDGMNSINGQSVWLGFFMYNVIQRFCKICEYKNDNERVKRYEHILEKLKESLNTAGWDGKWYKRAFFKDKTPLGSNENDECKIDGISQSWAVISTAGEYEKCVEAMNSLDSYLVDKENMIIKLLTPAFSKTSLEPGYIKSYIPGVRENGGQYTHGAIWSVIANAIMRNGERAGEYFRLLNPIEHARTKEAALKYKVEPYVVSADIYSNINMLGRGGWTWYTGSSSWLFIAGLEYVLGIKKEGNILKVNPCIPKEWESYSIKYRYKDAVYNINIYNPEHKSTGIKTIYVDNGAEKTNEIKLEENDEHTIDVIM